MSKRTQSRIGQEPSFLLQVPGSAELLGLHEETIRRWIASGRLPIAGRTAPGRGGRILLRRADVLAAVGIVEEAPAAPTHQPRPRRRAVGASA